MHRQHYYALDAHCCDPRACAFIRRSDARPKKEQGGWTWARGRLYDANFAKAHPEGPKEDKGLQTKDAARFFAISAKMNHTVVNKGRELVVQFSVKHGQKIDCGGGYIKVLPSGLRQNKFNGNDEYAIMFGPDICGTTLRRVQAIFHHAATGENLPMKREVKCEADEYSHLYTLVLRPGTSNMRGEAMKRGDVLTFCCGFGVSTPPFGGPYNHNANITMRTHTLPHARPFQTIRTKS